MKFQGKHSDITGQILEVYYKVYKQLGYGFNEKIYERAMILELAKTDLNVEAQKELNVFYDGKLLGKYFVDLLIENTVIVELKATKELNDAHRAQTLTYLRASHVEVALLINFGPKHEFERKMMRNSNKPSKTWKTNAEGRGNNL